MLLVFLAGIAATLLAIALLMYFNASTLEMEWDWLGRTYRFEKGRGWTRLR